VTDNPFSDLPGIAWLNVGRETKAITPDGSVVLVSSVWHLSMAGTPLVEKYPQWFRKQ
jgi:hypothetical protein